MFSHEGVVIENQGAAKFVALGRKFVVKLRLSFGDKSEDVKITVLVETWLDSARVSAKAVDISRSLSKVIPWLVPSEVIIGDTEDLIIDVERLLMRRACKIALLESAKTPW